MSNRSTILLRGALLAACFPLSATPVVAQRIIPVATSPAPAGPPLFYAQVASLVLAAPMIIDATVRSTTRIKGAEAAGVAPGHVRLYVEADVLALVRGSGTVPPRIGYVLDIAADGRGNPPKLRKARVLLFARAVGQAPDQVQLVSPDAQRPWSADLDALTRRVTTEVLAADAPPELTGVGAAFHVAGALPGESETQIFLSTKAGRPVSLGIVSRPGQAKTWSVSLSEIVGESARPPAADTLLWYRLACGLPAALPETSVSALAADDAAAAREDYAFVVAALGACGAAG